MAARVSPAAPWATRVSLAAPWVVVSAPWSCAACTFRNEGEAAACAVCLARRAQGAASAAPLTAALVESWSAADVARWVASLPGMTRAHGAVFVRGEVTGRRLLRMRVPELVAAGLLVGPAVDVDEALQRVRGAGAGDGRGAGAGDGRGGGDAALPQGPSLFEYLADNDVGRRRPQRWRERGRRGRRRDGCGPRQAGRCDLGARSFAPVGVATPQRLQLRVR